MLSPSTPYPNISQIIRKELVAILYKNLPNSMLSLSLVGIILLLTLYDNIELKLLIPWFVLFIIIILARIGLLMWYRATHSQLHLISVHYYLFLLGASASALMIGTLGSFLMPNDLPHQAFILIMITGLLAGSIQSLSASYLINMIYLLLALLPVEVWLAFQDNIPLDIHYGLLIGILLYIFFTLIISHNNHLYLLSNIKLKLENSELNVAIKELAVHDELTGLYNRHYLYEFLNLEIAKAQRNNSTLAIIMFDIDHFKELNDTYGHEAGDTVLQKIGAYFNENIRKGDMACRYGGEEFIIVFPNTPLETALARAEVIREGIKKLVIVYKQESIKGVAISGGIAAFPDHGAACKVIINASDTALYQAKHQGRDQVCIALRPNPEEEP
jgi:diguanylate cyclase (GGDEF)-like protein